MLSNARSDLSDKKRSFLWSLSSHLFYFLKTCLHSAFQPWSKSGQMLCKTFPHGLDVQPRLGGAVKVGPLHGRGWNINSVLPQSDSGSPQLGMALCWSASLWIYLLITEGATAVPVVPQCTAQVQPGSLLPATASKALLGDKVILHLAKAVLVPLTCFWWLPSGFHRVVKAAVERGRHRSGRWSLLASAGDLLPGSLQRKHCWVRREIIADRCFVSVIPLFHKTFCFKTGCLTTQALSLGIPKYGPGAMGHISLTALLSWNLTASVCARLTHLVLTWGWRVWATSCALQHLCTGKMHFVWIGPEKKILSHKYFDLPLGYTNLFLAVNGAMATVPAIWHTSKNSAFF